MATRSEPTGAAPGTSEKIEVMRQRAAMGYPLFHKFDCDNYRCMESIPMTTWQRRDEKAKEVQAKQCEGCVIVNNDLKAVLRVTVTPQGGWRCKLSCGHQRTISPREKKPQKLACPRCRVETHGDDHDRHPQQNPTPASFVVRQIPQITQAPLQVTAPKAYQTFQENMRLLSQPMQSLTTETPAARFLINRIGGPASDIFTGKLQRFKDNWQRCY